MLFLHFIVLESPPSHVTISHIMLAEVFQWGESVMSKSSLTSLSESLLYYNREEENPDEQEEYESVSIVDPGEREKT